MRPRTWRCDAGASRAVFDFKPRDHVEIGEKLKMMDFAAAGKISGARFTVLTGPLARLQRALIQFMLDLHTGEHGYRETYVPYLVNAQSLTGTGSCRSSRRTCSRFAASPGCT